MNEDIHCDLLVIGAGMAGMTAGARAAVNGLDVVVAGNPSTLVFSSGIMDYLGVYPAGNKTCLDDPEQGLNRLAREFPNHSYALAGHDKILESFEFVRTMFRGCRPSLHAAIQRWRQKKYGRGHGHGNRKARVHGA